MHYMHYIYLLSNDQVVPAELHNSGVKRRLVRNVMGVHSMISWCQST